MSSISLNSINKINNKLIDDLENPIIKYGFLILVVVKIILIENIPTEYLEIYDNNIVKIIYAFVIAYAACFDPIYSIALTTLIIIALQELYSRRATVTGNYMPKQILNNNNNNNNNNNDNNDSTINRLPKPFITSEKEGTKMSPQMVRYENNDTPSNQYLANDENIFAEINKHTLQKTPMVGDEKLIAEYDYYKDPAFRTITANLKDREIFGKNDFYVTADDLKNAETNKLNNKMNNSVQGFAGSINNIQGLPNGYDPKYK
jgi:hypothetical protein